MCLSDNKPSEAANIITASQYIDAWRIVTCVGCQHYYTKVMTFTLAW